MIEIKLQKPLVEQLFDTVRFTDEERQVLLEDGALVYQLRGETIKIQRENQERKKKPSFWYITNESEKLTGRRSKLSEVAIYPDPERFFIEGTGGNNLIEKEEIVKEDAQKERKRLGLSGITVVIPGEAATLTEVTFKHLDQTGKWLFGEEYAQFHRLQFIYGATKSPTDLIGSEVAAVGYANPIYGLSIRGWYIDRSIASVWAVRLIVPSQIS